MAVCYKYIAYSSTFNFMHSTARGQKSAVNKGKDKIAFE